MEKWRALTRAEILLAAAQAEGYPRGHAAHWGWGPLVDWHSGDPLPDPEVVREYGGPALVIAAGRGAATEDEVGAGLDLLARVLFIYLELLHRDPPAVAHRLRRIAERMKPGKNRAW